MATTERVQKDLSRCSWCGRKGTLTNLSTGNRCVLEDDCYEAREEAIALVAFLGAQGAQA